MAKAQFHKNQRVFVNPVGTWAQIEQVTPQWAKGVEEPIKVTYDVGLGRPFGAHELSAEQNNVTLDHAVGEDTWRLMRGQNKWKASDECSHHPHPGTYPVVVTSDRDWGGWRVPGAEYDHDPERIEIQARIIANSLRCVSILKRLYDYAEESPENLSNAMMDLAQDAHKVLEDIEQS